MVIFPATIGVTGEVHQKMGIRYENNFGEVGGHKQDDDDFDETASQRTAFSFTSARNYKLPGQQPYPGKPQATRLEQIKEDHPQEENDAGLNSTRRRRELSDAGGANPFKSSLNVACGHRGPAAKPAMDAGSLGDPSPLGTSQPRNISPLLSFDQAASRGDGARHEVTPELTFESQVKGVAALGGADLAPGPLQLLKL